MHLNKKTYGMGYKEFFEKRYATLDSEYQQFRRLIEDLAEYILPGYDRHVTSDVNEKGQSAWFKIIDSKATRAARILAAGLMGGLTSASRPWFAFRIKDPILRDNHVVKEWLSDATRILHEQFTQSNFYRAAAKCYLELGVFGTHAILFEDDPNDAFWFYNLPIGSYRLAADDKGRVDTCFRDLTMTVRQMATKFGEDNLPANIKQQLQEGKVEQRHDVRHVIAPNPEIEPNALEAYRHKPWVSLYYIKGQTDEKAHCLRASGYDEFPVLCPRWDTTGEDVYAGDCPGMQALGDVKSLQTLQRRKAQAVDKLVAPPLQGPASLRNKKVSNLPGGVTWVDDTSKGFTELYKVNWSPERAENDIFDLRNSIGAAFHEDLFQLFSQDRRSQVTAEEIRAMKDEKMQVMGPVLKRLDDEFLDPVVNRAFAICLKYGIIPEPPQEVQGAELDVEYISILDGAQKMVGLAGIQRWLDNIAYLAQMFPNITDKVNSDEVADQIADMALVPPAMVVPDEEVAQIRQARAQAAAEQEAMAQMQAEAQVAKDLSQTTAEEDNALAQMIRLNGGAA